jgi:hypothetical protein
MGLQGRLVYGSNAGINFLEVFLFLVFFPFLFVCLFVCLFGMPVEYVVLRCVSCSLFQSTQRRKDNKFKCKVCGTQQSVLKVCDLNQTHTQRDIRLRECC